MSTPVRSTPERWARAKELFRAALERSVSERMAFLRESCGADEELFAEVSSLVERLERTHGFLQHGPGAGLDEVARRVLAETTSHEELPARIAGFRIERVLGRGGMGVVYLAEQEQPRRSVALKVLSAAMLSPRARRRFEHEVEVLGRLRHSGIAQIHEAGTFLAEGIEVPYFAMELVQGAPLTDHARERRLGLRARLQLFAELCDAVEHAHQKGVVHRDLKPDNVLVDENGRAKVLDFGIAQVSDLDLRTTAGGTLVGELIGTLGSMSPEQARGEPGAVDTRTDVYALGVLLYELLAGVAPHDLTHASLPEALRVIECVDPRPLGAHARELRGDLETIVSKALEKDRERRYASASELAADVRRHLANEPIAARPASTVYRLGKFARRQPALVAGTAATLLSLCLGLATTTWKAVEAREGQRVAEAQASNVRSTLQFLQRMLASVDAEVALGRDTGLMEAMLDEAASRVESETAGTPDVQAALRETIGWAYLSIGELDPAEEHLRAALRLREASPATRRAELGRALHWLARAVQARGRPSEAAQLFERAIAELRASGGGDELALSGALFDYARLMQEQAERERSEALALEALAIRERLCGRRSSPVANCLDLLGALAREKGSWAQAEQGIREALDIRESLFADRAEGATLHELLFSMTNFAGFLFESGRGEEAGELWRKVLEEERRLHPLGHSDVAMALYNLAYLLSSQGDRETARAMVEEAREIQVGIYGEESVEAVFATNNLAMLLLDLGEGAQAEEMLRSNLDLLRGEVNANPELVRASLKNLGSVLRVRGRLDAARETFLEALELTGELGDEHQPERVGILIELGDVHREQGEGAEAIARYEEALGIALDHYPGSHPQVLWASRSMTDCLFEQGEVELAIERLRADLQALRSARPAGTDEITLAALRLGVTLVRTGEFEEAERLVRERCEATERTYGSADPRTREAFQQLALLYERWGKPERAGELRSVLAR